MFPLRIEVSVDYGAVESFPKKIFFLSRGIQDTCCM